MPDESSCNRAFRKHSSNDRARRLGRGTALRRELSFPRRMRRWAATHCWLVATAAALLGASLLAGAVALALRPSYAVRQFRSGLAYIEQGRDDLAIHCLSAFDTPGTAPRAVGGSFFPRPQSSARSAGDIVPRKHEPAHQPEA